jgi:hypothetical protein
MTTTTQNEAMLVRVRDWLVDAIEKRGGVVTGQSVGGIPDHIATLTGANFTADISLELDGKEYWLELCLQDDVAHKFKALRAGASSPGV